MARVKVALITYSRRERAPEYPELSIFTQDFAYRLALPTRRNRIRQLLTQGRDCQQQADAG